MWLGCIINFGLTAKLYVHIILSHARTTDLHDKCWVARTLAEKNLKEAVPFLLSIFYDWNGEPWDLLGCRKCLIRY